jgi:hypothetical protein
MSQQEQLTTEETSVSHQILNKLDDVKTKLTDQEYKVMAELLAKQHMEDFKQNKSYVVVISVPRIFIDDECNCCNCGDEKVMHLGWEKHELDTTMSKTMHKLLKDKIKNGKNTFYWCRSGASVEDDLEGMKKWKALNSIMTLNERMMDKRLEDVCKMSIGRNYFTILSIKRN